MGALVTDAPGAEARSEQLGLAAATTAAVGGALVLTRNVVPFGLPCPTLALTGVPCPGCGMTRLADAVLHGRLLEVVTVDPAGVVLLALIAAVALTHVLRRRVPRRGTALLTPARVSAVGVAALAAHWLTTLVTGGMLTA